MATLQFKITAIVFLILTGLGKTYLKKVPRTEYPVGVRLCIIRHLTTGLVVTGNGTAAYDPVVLEHYSGVNNQLWYELQGQNNYSTFINLAASNPSKNVEDALLLDAFRHKERVVLFKKHNGCKDQHWIYNREDYTLSNMNKRILYVPDDNYVPRTVALILVKETTGNNNEKFYIQYL